MPLGILFKHLFKIVGIPPGYAKTIDDNEGIQKVWKGLQGDGIIPPALLLQQEG